MRLNPSIPRRALQALALSLALFVFCGAGDPTSRFNTIGHQLMCICGCNQILLECNHVGCPDSDGMRNELMTAVTRGDSDSLVQQAFVQKYGPTVLAAPTTQGFDRTAWIFPFVAFGVGVVTVVLVVRTWRNRPPSPPSAGASAPGGQPPKEPPLKGNDLEQFRQQARRETDL
jgi:cytochrome c-type biogenesis protein CcmH